MMYKITDMFIHCLSYFLYV